jgi:alkyl hydroperoxide reductase subunit AhpC
LQAIDFTDKNGEVCPAGWRPGKRTMKPDPEGSLSYFSTVDEAPAKKGKTK